MSETVITYQPIGVIHCGVFAARAPCRPNATGPSVVK